MVESMGPPCPPDTMYACVKDWNALIICMTRLKKMMGDSAGRVMEMNRRTFPAPSTCAASYYSCGICFSPRGR